MSFENDSLEIKRFFEEEYKYLDSLIFDPTGPGKKSSGHNYTEPYSQWLVRFRDLPIKFLEIGIRKGDSVRLWEQYFKKADLHFIDIKLDEDAYRSERSKYYLVDQEDPEQLRNFIRTTGGEFDVIIDDGGHTMNQQITSFVELFPHVKSKGVYIVEDLHTSYWVGGELHSRKNPYAPTMVEFLKILIDKVNALGAISGMASHRREIDPNLLSRLDYYQREIASIAFFDSVAMIEKR